MPAHRTKAVTQRGVALLLVLWVIVLLGILLGGFLLIARTDQLQTRYLVDATRARYAAEAGLGRAVYELRRIDPQTRWVADGRAYEWRFNDTELRISVQDESGKVDINAADENTWLSLLLAVRVPDEDARKLVDAIFDWRDPDDLVRAQGAEKNEYQAAERSYAPTNRGFSTVGELQQVLGMDYALFRKLEPLVTVYARSPRPNFAFAPAPVLQMVPGMTPERAQEWIQQRNQLNAMQLSQTPLLLPDGTPVLAASTSQTYTIESKAALPNGAWTQLNATIRLGGASGNRAYTILRWREGENKPQ